MWNNRDNVITLNTIDTSILLCFSSTEIRNETNLKKHITGISSVGLRIYFII